MKLLQYVFEFCFIFVFKVCFMLCTLFATLHCILASLFFYFLVPNVCLCCATALCVQVLLYSVWLKVFVTQCVRFAS